MSGPILAPYSSLRKNMTLRAGGARSRDVMTMNGQKRSFQWAVTEKVAKAVIAGQATGTKTRQTKDHSPSPSTRAASNSSLEVLLKDLAKQEYTKYRNCKWRY